MKTYKVRVIYRGVTNIKIETQVKAESEQEALCKTSYRWLNAQKIEIIHCEEAVS